MKIKDKLLKRLPHNYSKKSDSKIAKILELIAQELEELTTAKEEIKACRDIDQATGQTLDSLGQSVQQGRRGREDQLFRFFIKSKIAINRSSATIDDLINILAALLDIKSSQIYLEERLDQEAASIYLRVPLLAINKMGLSRKQFIEVVEQILSAAVRVYSNLEGTFSLGNSDSSDNSSNQQGFGGVNSSTGGFFGSWQD